MATDIYLSDRSSRDGYWTSFETDPYLTIIKRTIRYRCIPCIENLHDQLVAGSKEIQLDQAFDCWKVVVVLNDEDECLQVLERYQERFLPGRYIRGRFGSKEKFGTKAIVVNADSEQERDTLVLELGRCGREVNPNCQIFYSKACAYLYEEILGDWRYWEKVSPIKHPENVGKIVQRIKDLLTQ